MSAPHEETKTELVIDRKRWLRGEGDRYSVLLRPSDGKMCCLGFFACSLGAAADQIAGRATPMGASGVAWPPWMFRDKDLKLTGEGTALIRTNDSRELPDSERETQIAAIFARHGVTVRFVDEPEAQP